MGKCDQAGHPLDEDWHSSPISRLIHLRTLHYWAFLPACLSMLVAEKLELGAPAASSAPTHTHTHTHMMNHRSNHSSCRFVLGSFVFYFFVLISLGPAAASGPRTSDFQTSGPSYSANPLSTQRVLLSQSASESMRQHSPQRSTNKASVLHGVAQCAMLKLRLVMPK
ncbi:hypothetical protein LZ30DRAFT_40928 [Colletotrichum cereale]|nr:hypothetical protein LZ30DRAFT_40928 [Colletotrichum cereale]